MLRVLAGLVVGVPLGWLLSEVRRGWKAGSAPAGPPFAPELADAPRQPGEPAWFPLADQVDDACSEVYAELLADDLAMLAEHDRTRPDRPTPEEVIQRMRDNGLDDPQD